MYRIVKETNLLSGRTEWIIERRKKFLWFESWTRDLGLDLSMRGPVGASTLDGAKYKLQIIKDNDSKMIHLSIID